MSGLLVIANKALRNVGKTELDSLTQQGPAADRCNRAVRDIVKEVLRQHPWGFATVWASPPKLLTGPPFYYQYAYQLPVEMVKLIDVREDPDLRAKVIPYQLVRGKVLYTNADPCYARYIVYFEEDLSEAPPDFIKACGFLLAADIAPSLARMNDVSGLLNAYMSFLDQAKLADAVSGREEVKDENQTCKFLTARGYPSYVDGGGESE